MALFFSAAARGFVDDQLHRELPADAVPVTAAEHRRFLDARRQGHQVEPDELGRPHVVKCGVSIEERRATLATRIKREARRRILAIASIEQQSNDNAAIALMALQIAALGDATIDAFSATQRREAIDAIRRACDAFEGAIAPLGVRALAHIDPAADHHWPQEIPA